MRLLIYLLALMSAFFVSADDDYVSAESQPTKGICLYSRYSISTLDVSECMEFALSKVQTPSDWVYSHTEENDSVFKFIYYRSDGFGPVDIGKLTLSAYEYSCPPSNNPAYTESSGSGQSMKCYIPQDKKDCPAGYHSKAVSKALGSTECVPKECPPAGTGENLASTPMTGGVPFSGGGMYCNDGCAYSVNSSQISSEKYAVGTSQGAACGDKPYDNKKLADEGENDKCSTATNGEVTILSCADATPTTDPKPPLDNDDSKAPQDDTPDKPKETCQEGDTSCNLKNVEIELENSTKKQIDNDNKLHNKQIDAATKNTQSILNALDSLDTTLLLQTKQDERLHAITISKFNELVDAVNGIEISGGGGGGGSSGGSTGSGGDCDGDPSECVPIEGAEIPSETINLEQYADKYDGWLPNAELPPEKCITLTNGKSICFSFEAFILLFQGISGLLVIGALMHSARIISGAI